MQKKRRENNLEKYRQRGREQYTKHRDTQKVREKIKYDADPEKYRALQKAYYTKNRDMVLLKKRMKYQQEQIKKLMDEFLNSLIEE